MSLMEAVGILYAVVVLVVLVAILLLLRTLEQEFHADHGHSLRDASDRIEKLVVTAGTDAVGVANDLAASIKRADAVEGSPGEASDAASRSPQED